MPGSPSSVPTPASSSTSDETPPAHKVGDLVTRTYFDPFSGAGGAEVTTVGMVVGVVDFGEDPAYRGPAGEQRPNGFRVAWLQTASDPIDGDELARLSTKPTRSRQ